jgi:cytosine/adenosine deaminase-related metal-dependent hydrolase
MEARNAMLLGRLRHGPARVGARQALDLATRGGATCLGREGEIGQLRVGACGDVVVWGLDGVVFAGALDDPIEALLRCGPASARHTIVGGRFLVEGGRLVHTGVDDMLRRHRAAAGRLQAPFGA